MSLLGWNDSNNRAKASTTEGVRTISEVLREYVSSQNDCGSTVMMARQGDAVAGLYIGKEVLRQSAIELLSDFILSMTERQNISGLAAQACPDDTPSSWIAGIYADYHGNISAMQEALRMWAEGKCLNRTDRMHQSKEIDIKLVRATGIPVRTGIHWGLGQSSKPVIVKATKRGLVRRDECRPIQVTTNDGCSSLAQRCGITQADFESYNPISDLCDMVKGVRPQQWVCCSKGDLPDSRFPYLGCSTQSLSSFNFN